MDVKQKFIQKSDIVAPSSSASKTYQNRTIWVESPIANVADELRSLPQKDCQCLAYTRAITWLNKWTTHYVKVKWFCSLFWPILIRLHYFAWRCKEKLLNHRQFKLARCKRMFLFLCNTVGIFRFYPINPDMW